jgi:Protein of unknown function (DUF2934)
MNTVLHARVEERAYAIWNAEGQPHGRHEEHWSTAEREIAAEAAAGRAAKPRRNPVAAPRKPRRQAAAARAS